MSDGRLVVGPFNRVEGDLEVHLDIAEGRVSSARVNAPLFRGFERMLEGKDPRDALTITVITSYSIHYTKLYDRACLKRGHCRRRCV